MSFNIRFFKCHNFLKLCHFARPCCINVLMGFTVWIQRDSWLGWAVGPLRSTRPRIGRLTMTAWSSVDRCRYGLIRRWFGHRHQAASAVGSRNSVIPPFRLVLRWRSCWHAASPDNRVRPELAAAGWVGLGYTGFQHLMSTSADTEREPAVSRIYRATEPPNRQHRHQGRRWRRVERTQARRLQAPCLA